jgi:hypothetical protein
MQSMIIQKHILQDLSNPRSHYNHIKDISGLQAIKFIIIIQNAYKNPVIVSRTHKDIELDDSPFDAYTIFVSFMILTVIIRHDNHQKNFQCFADDHPQQAGTTCGAACREEVYTLLRGGASSAK